MIEQIALPLGFDRQFSFDNYFASRADFIVSSLKSFVGSGEENFIVLWGGRDSGKTHLLNATARYAREKEAALQLYDACQLVNLTPACLGELPGSTMLAIDNLDFLSGKRDWEVFFYDLINRCHQHSFRLLISMTAKPQELNAVLADFQSRLSWGLLMELDVADEVAIGEIIRERALLLGHRLSNEVIAYMLRHYSRELRNQLEILRKLDGVSLATGKRITIPLIKQEMGYGGNSE